MHLTDINVDSNGVKLTLEVEVDENGKFTTAFGGEAYQADTLERLRIEVRDGVLASRVELPFVTRRGRRGVMRGFHASQQTILVTWDDGTKGTLSTHEQVWPVVDEETRLRIIQFYDEIAKQQEQLDVMQRQIETKPARELLVAAVGEDITVHPSRRQPVAA